MGRENQFGVDPSIINCIGVYKIYHIKEPDEFYIGSTKKDVGRKGRIGFGQRFNKHLYLLRRGKHYSKKLQDIVFKHGIEGVRFEIIEVVGTSECALDREQFFLDTLLPSLNTVKNSRSTVGYKHTDHFKKMASLNRKGVKKGPMSDSGRQKISSWAKNRDISYLLDPGIISRRAAKMKGRAIHPNLLNSIIMPVNQLDENGNIIASFTSLKDAADSIGIHYSGISKCISGRQKFAGSFRWEKRNKP